MQVATVDVAGLSVCVRTSGPADGVPLVFWHGLGFGGNGSFLDVATPALDRAGIYTVALDAPGFGRSDALPRDSYDITILAELLWDVVDGLQLARPVVLAGHSWGGTVAITAAARRPGDVAGLAFFDSGHRDYADWPGANPDATVDDLVAELEAETMPSTWSELAAILEAEGLGQPWTLAAWKEGFAETADGLRWLGTNEVLAAARVGLMQGRASASWPAIAAAETPTLFLLATEPPEEREGNERCAGLLREAIPQADVRLVHGMRHAVFADLGADAGILVADWLRTAGVAR